MIISVNLNSNLTFNIINASYSSRVVIEGLQGISFALIFQKDP